MADLQREQGVVWFLRHHRGHPFASSDQLHGDGPLDRLGLLGHPDGSHAAFADLQKVGLDSIFVGCS
jgi:hypothetical protein